MSVSGGMTQHGRVGYGNTTRRQEALNSTQESPTMNQSQNNIESSSDADLKALLLTTDGKGKEVKSAALSELLSREFSKGRDAGAFEQSFYSQT